MKTIKISNGMLSFSSDGQLEIVDGANKAAQDIANAILTKYNTHFDTGSTLADIELNSDMSELAIERSVYDAIYRLISVQVNASQDDRIVRVEQIKTATVDATTVVFYVQVLHESGQTAEFSDIVTSLDHLIDTNKVMVQ